MLTKNQIYEAVITDYTAEGQGIAHIEGCAVFIPNAIAGEKVRVRIEKAAKSWASGKIVELLEKSPHRRSVFNSVSYFYATGIFHKSRKGFLSLKKARRSVLFSGAGNRGRTCTPCGTRS